MNEYAEKAFAKAMESRQYGESETDHARAWFLKGFQAASDVVEVELGLHSIRQGQPVWVIIKPRDLEAGTYNVKLTIKT